MSLGRHVRPVGSFDRASLALSHWQTTVYGGSPWVGTASAGLSGGRDITAIAGQIPGTGTSLNSLTVADFDGSNDQMTTSLTTGDLITTTAWSSWVLFNADSAAADFGATARYLNAQFWTDGLSAYVGMGFSDAGIHVMNHDGVSHKELVIACGTGGWHLAQAKCDGSNMKLRLDSGSWSSIAFTTLTDATSTPVRFGTSYDAATSFFDGKIAEIATAKVTFDDATFDLVKANINSVYALAL